MHGVVAVGSYKKGDVRGGGRFLVLSNNMWLFSLSYYKEILGSNFRFSRNSIPCSNIVYDIAAILPYDWELNFFEPSLRKDTAVP